MENLEELKKKCTEISAELNRINAEIERIEKGQQGRWKPGHNENYWSVMGNGNVDYFLFNTASDYDNGCYEKHNCFKTEEEAQSRADKIKIYWQLYDLAERLNKGEKINWKNQGQRKYFIYYSDAEEHLDYDYGWVSKMIGQIYCLDENFLDTAIEEIRRR